jgi:hypothetical protein
MFSGAEGAFIFRTNDSDEWREFQEWKRRKAAEEPQ